MKHALRALFTLAAIVCASPVWAASTPFSMTVNATVAAACNVSSAAVQFGTNLPVPATSNIDVQATVAITCANGTPYTIAANAGNGAGATVASRRMRLIGGSALLTYSLYTDAARTTIWGDGTAGTVLLTGTANGATQQIPVYGRIPSGQSPASGTYFDTVTLLVTF